MSIKKNETFYEAINTNEDGTVKKKSNKKNSNKTPEENKKLNKKSSNKTSEEDKDLNKKSKITYKTLSKEEKEFRDKINEFMLEHVFYDERYAGRVPSLFYNRVNGALKEYRFVHHSINYKKDIYTFKEFYIACVLSVDSIDHAMANVQFEDTAHIINYILKIIRSKLVEVGDMKTFEEIKEEASKNLEKSLDTDEKKIYNPEDTYIRKSSDEEDKYLEEFI